MKRIEEVINNNLGYADTIENILEKNNSSVQSLEALLSNVVVYFRYTAGELEKANQGIKLTFRSLEKLP